jgi:hypothetical protein
MANEPEVAFRIVVVRPPPGVSFGVQLGKTGTKPGETELLRPSHSGGDLVFDLRLRWKRVQGGGVVFLGPAAQGPPQDRFIYVNSGTMAGQPGTPWTRRAKLKLATIDEKAVRKAGAAPGSRMEGRIAGTAGDGGPCCGTVPLLGGGWKTE